MFFQLEGTHKLYFHLIRYAFRRIFRPICTHTSKAPVLYIPVLVTSPKLKHYIFDIYWLHFLSRIRYWELPIQWNLCPNKVSRAVLQHWSVFLGLAFGSNPFCHGQIFRKIWIFDHRPFQCSAAILLCTSAKIYPRIFVCMSIEQYNGGHNKLQVLKLNPVYLSVKIDSHDLRAYVDFFRHCFLDAV